MATPYLAFTNPPGGGEKGRYIRHPGRDSYLIAPTQISAIFRHDETSTQPITLLLVRAPQGTDRILLGYEVVDRAPTMPANDLRWNLDPANYASGQYAIIAEEPIYQIVLPLVIDNGDYRADVPQHVCMAPQVGVSGFSDEYAGWCWILWPGHMPKIRETKRPIRKAIKTEGRISEKDTFVERYGDIYPRNGMPYRFCVNDRGYISLIYHQQYKLAMIEELWNGLNRDGYSGSVAGPAGGFVHADGSLILSSRVGRVVRVHLDGRIETLLGKRIPWDQPQPLTNAKQATYDAAYETVGVGLAPGCHDVCGDPDDPDLIYIADTGNHCIVVYNLATKQSRVLVGVRGEPGYTQGLSEPRGVDIGPDGLLAIADYRNVRIVWCDRVTGAIVRTFESVRPSGEHRPADWDGTTKIVEHFSPTKERFRELAKWGVEGEAAFMYPAMCRYDSDGNLIIAHDRQAQLGRLVMSEMRLEYAGDLHGGRFNKKVSTYPVISVDRWGGFGETDDVLSCNWEHNSDWWTAKDGSRVMFEDRPAIPRSIHNKSPKATLWNGPWPSSEQHRYPQWVVVGHDGSVWTGGVSGGGIQRHTRLNPADRAVDIPRSQDGNYAWERRYHRDLPVPRNVGGHSGQDMFGGETFDSMCDWSDDQIMWYLEHDLKIGGLTEREKLDLLYWIRLEGIPGSVVVDGEVMPPIVPTPTPEPDPTPVPDPQPLPEEDVVLLDELLGNLRETMVVSIDAIDILRQELEAPGK